ncbi:hypothetical protein M8J77_024284 [Diaphorina citri]|nr:hypothetical protein M8J77_024284 [Diaphorina citri]
MHSIDAEFFVVRKKGISLLSCQTSKQLNLIQFLFSLRNYDEAIRTQYSSLFSGLGKLKDKQVHLHVDPDVQPVANQHRRIPVHQRKAVEAEIERLEKQGIVEKVSGPTPWVSPVVLVPKASDPKAIRLCVDMRVPNKAIKRERHITPTIDDLVSELSGATVFSKLDLNEGYHQIELDEESRNMTTFSTHIGLRRYTRLNFGTNSAAEKFHDEIRQVLVNIPGALNVSDDIIVFGKNQDEHDKALHNTLQRLQEHGLTLNSNKCKFNLKEVKFYGYLFSKDGIKPDPAKVDGFCELDTPKNVSEVRSLLGMINYCARFIPNLASLTLPIRNLTKKDVEFCWGVAQEKAFITLKERLKNSLMNSFFDTNKETHLVVDAGPEGLGAILSQSDGISSSIIACASTTLTETQKRYSQIEKEMLAVVWAIDHFSIYLKGSSFVVYSDHKPVVNLLTNQKNIPSARLERLIFKIQSYDFRIIHTPGALNPSDYMSRHPNHEVCQQFPEEEFIHAVSERARPIAITREQIILETKADSTLQSVIHLLGLPNQENVWKTSDLIEYKKIRDELTVTDDGILLRGRRIVIPQKLQARTLYFAHKGHFGLVKTKQLLRGKVWFPGMDKMIENKIKSCIPCQTTVVSNHPAPLCPTPLPDQPWSNLAIDFAGPFDHNEYALVLIDEYTRYPFVEIIPNIRTPTVVKILKKIFSMFGIPNVLKSDNGPPFNGEEFTEYLTMIGCKHRRITPYWPQANGCVERFVRNLKNFIQSCKVDEINWRDELNEFLFMYRTTPHCTTQFSPADLLLNYSPRTLIPGYDEHEIPQHEEVKRNDDEKKKKMKDYVDGKRRAKPLDLCAGDQVLMKKKPDCKYFNSKPLEIIDIKGNQVTAQNEDETITRNSTFFRAVPHPTQSPDDLPPPTSDSQVDVQSEPEEIEVAVETPSSPNVSPPILRRSTRETRPPQRYGEWI